MSTFQLVMIVGNVGKDPEVRYMPNGKAVAEFSLATSEKWTDKNTGEKREETEWHRCKAYDRLAEVIGEYVKKGSTITVTGKHKTSKWEDREGITRYSTDTIVSEMKIIKSPRESDEGGTQEPRQRANGPAPRAGSPAPAPRQAPAQSSSGFDDMDDDIPY